MQLVLPRPGLAAFAHAAHCYPLPEGLAAGTSVVVIEAGPGLHHAIVEDAAGKQWRLFHWQVDCGRLLKVNGQWLAPHEPEVLAHLRAQLAKPRPDDLTLAQLQYEVNAITWELLRRWG